MTWVALHVLSVAQLQRGAADFEIIPARIGALAPVAAPPQALGRKQAQTAVRITQGAVNEDFRLDARCRRDIAHFLESQLARQHHAGKAHLPKHFRTGSIVHRQLGAGVQF